MKQSKFFITLLICFVLIGTLAAQPSIGDLIDAIKNADTIEGVFALYTVLASFATFIAVQVAKLIPSVDQIKGKWITILVLVAILVISAVKFGTDVFLTSPFIWTFVTMFYDKFFKEAKDEAKLKKT